MKIIHYYVTCFIVLGVTSMAAAAIARAASKWQPRRPLIQHQQQQRKDIAMPRETNTCQERMTTGSICESCELLSFCIHHSNGWMNIPVEACDTENGFYCNSRLGMCTNMTGPCHPFGYEANFQCTSQGVFPDPYDCQKYHVCHFVSSTLVAATVDCVANKAFNAATGQCTLTLDHSVCVQRQFECRYAGDGNAWPSNPNIFYICKATSNQDQRVLYPSLYRCADGEIFDGYYCNVNSDTNIYPTVQTTVATNTNNNNNNNSGTTNDPLVFNSSATTASPSVQACSEIGLTADPDNCRRYYYCSGVNGIRKLLECPTGTFYNQVLSSCTLGSC